MVSVEEAKSLICEMCRNFYSQGWVSGTGGGMSIKAGDKIVMAPSGVQKERMEVSDMFVLDLTGQVLVAPEKRANSKPPKLSECSPLFMSAFELRGAGAVLHSHSLNAVMATLLQPEYEGQGCAGEFRVTNLEMIKGIAGHGYFDDCIVPIIENTARESELTESLRAAIAAYPKANAVLVKRHGVYVWGDTWVQAKTQAECYEYLFEAAVKLKALGVDVSREPKSKRQANGHLVNGSDSHAVSKKAKLSHARAPRAIVLDIEGTILPISFVSEALFPYAKAHLKEHLEANHGSRETQTALSLLQKEAQATVDGAEVHSGAKLATADLLNAAAAIPAAVRFVEALMAEDKKSTGLKALQGQIWKKGFESGELKGELFPDVLPEIVRWTERGIKVYIYSSGSCQAQRDLLSHTTQGDLRHHLSAFFDTQIGAKVEPDSYAKIALMVGADKASDIIFATDNINEAVAAEAAGWQVYLVERPGNATLPSTYNKTFRVIDTLSNLLQL